MSEKLNRQQQRSRKMLCEALLELLQEKPLERISISELSDRADLSRSTFYTNFESKEELLEFYIDDIVVEVLDGITPEGFGRLGWVGESYGTQFLADFASHPQLMRLLESPEIGHIVLNRIHTHHQQVYEKVLSRNVPDFNQVLAEYFIEFISYTSFAILNQWIKTGMQQSVEDIGKLLDEFLLPVGSLDVIERFSKQIK